MNNKLADLRNHLFATLEALADPDKPMELARAKTIAEVGQVLVDTAKVECMFLNLVGGVGSGFIREEKGETPVSPRPSATVPGVGHLSSHCRSLPRPAGDTN